MEEIFESGEYKAVLGKNIAELMEVGIGDYITLLVKDRNNTFNTIDVEIAGLHIPVIPMSTEYCFPSLELARQALAVGEEAAIIIRLEDRIRRPDWPEYWSLI